MKTMEISESDCCGNGCANCILDLKIPFQKLAQFDLQKPNIIANYTKWRIDSTKSYFPHSADVRDLHFSYAGGDNQDKSVLYIPPGHHLMMRVQVGDSECNYCLRPYSPYWVDSREWKFHILINLQPNGPMSKYIGNLKQGDEVEFRGPIGIFKHDVQAASCLILMSQGVGISSSLPIIRAVLDNEDDMSRIYHVACFRDLRHAYFRDQIEEFNKFWNYRGMVYLAHEICDEKSCIQSESNEPCKHLKSKLKYKEPVFLRKFESVDLENIIGECGQTKRIYVISGSRQFQDSLTRLINNLDANEVQKQIVLL